MHNKQHDRVNKDQTIILFVASDLRIRDGQMADSFAVAVIVELLRQKNKQLTSSHDAKGTFAS